MPTMTVTLTEEDGTKSQIEVPSRKREIKSRQISATPAPSVWIEEPLPHAEYEFRAVIGGFLASRKRR